MSAIHRLRSEFAFHFVKNTEHETYAEKTGTQLLRSSQVIRVQSPSNYCLNNALRCMPVGITFECLDGERREPPPSVKPKFAKRYNRATIAQKHEMAANMMANFMHDDEVDGC